MISCPTHPELLLDIYVNITKHNIHVKREHTLLCLKYELQRNSQAHTTDRSVTGLCVQHEEADSALFWCVVQTHCYA